METIASKSIEQMVEDNQRLVYFIIQRKFSSLMNDEDIQQVGMIGLWKACKAFDPTKSKFATFATRCITNEILMELRKRKKWDYNDQIVSIDSEIPGTEGWTWSECIESKIDYIQETEVMTAYSQTMEKLPDRTKRILAMFQSGMTQHQIAVQMGLSQSYISRIVKNARNQFKALL